METCFAPQQRTLFEHFNFQKWSEAVCFFHLLTGTCASRHNSVDFLNISTSKSGPKPSFFSTFDLETCFAPQWHAAFHLSSGQLASHLPLEQAYFSTLRSHKSFEKRSESRLSDLFAHLHLLSSLSFSSLIFSFCSSPLCLFPPLLFHLPILSEV